MQLEIGKHYQRADGKKIGPARKATGLAGDFGFFDVGGQYYTIYGEAVETPRGLPEALWRLVAEVPTTVTPTQSEPLDPKGDAGALKTPLHLVPPALLEACAMAMKNGAERYGAWNFRDTKVKASTYLGAVMRHIDAWRDGEDIDPDSGVSHLGHAAANLAILLDTAKHGTLVDDRWKGKE